MQKRFKNDVIENVDDIAKKDPDSRHVLRHKNTTIPDPNRPHPPVLPESGVSL